jgi:chromate transporter
VAINSATFVGYRTAGFWGAVFATLGVVLPSFCIILAIAYLLDNFMEIKAVQYAFKGINAGVLALLFKALWNMYKKSPKSWAAYVVMGASFLLTAILKVNLFIVIVGCAVFGLITATIAERRLKK